MPAEIQLQSAQTILQPNRINDWQTFSATNKHSLPASIALLMTPSLI